MITDIAGTILTPGDLGKNCRGNGLHDGIECCCEECDYMRCCYTDDYPKACLTCDDTDCPHWAKPDEN